LFFVKKFQSGFKSRHDAETLRVFNELLLTADSGNYFGAFRFDGCFIICPFFVG